MFRLSRKATIALVAAAGVAIPCAAAAEPRNDFVRTVGGLTVYLGVMPAAIIKGHPTMHGGPRKGPHEYHVVVAIFEAASGARISDATVSAKVSGLGLSGREIQLEPMAIADTITYGNFVHLPGADVYTIRLSIQRPSLRQPAVVDFKYAHRGR